MRWILLLTIAALAACATPSGIEPRGFPPERLPIDLERFAGDWYVIAHIPTGVEEQAWAAVESYRLQADGTIDVQFRFCEGAANGPLQTVEMLGWVHDPKTNAEWRVRPFWPVRLDYQILELDPDYLFTVIGHPSKNYAWVMARSPRPAETAVSEAIDRLAARGYAMERLRRVPQPSDHCREQTDARIDPQ